MHQVSHVGDGLKRDLGSIKSAAPGGRAWLELLRATFLAFLLRFPGILIAAGLD